MTRRDDVTSDWLTGTDYVRIPYVGHLRATYDPHGHGPASFATEMRMVEVAIPRGASEAERARLINEAKRMIEQQCQDESERACRYCNKPVDDPLYTLCSGCRDIVEARPAREGQLAASGVRGIRLG